MRCFYLPYMEDHMRCPYMGCPYMEGRMRCPYIWKVDMAKHKQKKQPYHFAHNNMEAAKSTSTQGSRKIVKIIPTGGDRVILVWSDGSQTTGRFGADEHGFVYSED